MANPRERTPEGKFERQRYNAIRRGVEWCLSFDEWWAIWEKSGRWEQRGRGGYVMARSGDVGPYAVGNVMIITIQENVSTGPHKKCDLPMGVSLDERRARKYVAHRCIDGKIRYVGSFPTPELAHAAYLAAADTAAPELARVLPESDRIAA